VDGLLERWPAWVRQYGVEPHDGADREARRVQLATVAAYRDDHGIPDEVLRIPSPGHVDRAERHACAVADEAHEDLRRTGWVRDRDGADRNTAGAAVDVPANPARVSKLRPEYAGIDPVDKTAYQPGEIAQCDLWFPETPIPVAAGQDRVLPVLVMVLGFSRTITAQMIQSSPQGRCSTTPGRVQHAASIIPSARGRASRRDPRTDGLRHPLRR